MEKTINIKKAKIIDGVFLEIEYTETEADGDSSVSTDFKGLFRKRIHEDLLGSFDRLKVHLAFLSEYVDVTDDDHFETEDIFEDKRFDKFKVTQFSMGGSDESYGVTLTGQKKLRGNKILNLNAPFTKFEEQRGQDEYQFLNELYHHVMKAINEVELYLNGKHVPDPQLDLFEGEDPKDKWEKAKKDLNDKGYDVTVTLGNK
jgi:hypothetical protein